jgi:predicted RNase H-like HicB family nuclease
MAATINSMKLTAVDMKVPEGFVAFVEELPGANTQGDTIEEARENLKAAVMMVLDANRELSQQAIQERIWSARPSFCRCMKRSF